MTPTPSVALTIHLTRHFDPHGHEFWIASMPGLPFRFAGQTPNKALGALNQFIPTIKVPTEPDITFGQN